MDSVRIEMQPDGRWKIHVPGQPDIFLSTTELADLIDAIDNVR